MGVYFNPGCDGFRKVVHEDYADKTGLISVVNQAIGTAKRICSYFERRDSHRI